RERPQAPRPNLRARRTQRGADRMDVARDDIDHCETRAFVRHVTYIDSAAALEQLRDELPLCSVARRTVSELARPCFRECNKRSQVSRRQRWMYGEYRRRTADQGDVGEVFHRI